MSYLDLIERDLVDAARRRAQAGGGGATVARLRPRRSTGSLLLAAALALVVAGSAMAGTLYVLRGSAIPAPAEVDAGPAQTPAAGSGRVLPQRAADPGGGPAWALRVARSRTGLVCSTVGQEVDGDFGIVGRDDRFRPLAEGVVDGCGQARQATATLIGARVFEARELADVRTVVNGVAGDGLRRVTVDAGGRRRSAAVGPGGSFLIALRGYPEFLGLDVRLEFADGRAEDHPLGRSPSVVPDPAGDRAWVTFPFTTDRYPGRCLQFSSSRPGRGASSSPAICARRRVPYFFAARRIRPDGRRWRAPARTAIWGELGGQARYVEVVAGRDVRRPPVSRMRRPFLVVFPASVDPASIRVRIRMRDGSTRELRGQANLITPPKGFR